MDALSKLLIEKGIITRAEFVQKIFRATGDVSAIVESDPTVIDRTSDDLSDCMPRKKSYGTIKS
jgi:hypothetical protein